MQGTPHAAGSSTRSTPRRTSSVASPSSARSSRWRTWSASSPPRRSDRRWWGARGEGAFCNGSPIRVSRSPPSTKRTSATTTSPASRSTAGATASRPGARVRTHARLRRFLGTHAGRRRSGGDRGRTGSLALGHSRDPGHRRRSRRPLHQLAGKRAPMAAARCRRTDGCTRKCWRYWSNLLVDGCQTLVQRRLKAFEKIDVVIEFRADLRCVICGLRFSECADQLPHVCP